MVPSLIVEGSCEKNRLIFDCVVCPEQQIEILTNSIHTFAVPSTFKFNLLKFNTNVDVDASVNTP